MKKYYYALFLALALLCLPLAQAQALEVNAAAAILMDARTGRVLFALNENERLPIASTTKLMTALTALRNTTDLRATVTLPTDFVNVGESSIYLEPGESHPLDDLFHAMLIRSANDAAQAVAIGVSGSEEGFVALMNQTSLELGLANSQWKNVHGLDAEGHYSSAYDLACIMQAALDYDLFRQIIATERWSIPWPDYGYDPLLINTNELLRTYEYMDGGKTGYTDGAGPCLVVAATKGDTQLIGVLLNCETRPETMAALLDYGFDNFACQQMAAAGISVAKAEVVDGRAASVGLVLADDAWLCQSISGLSTPEPVYDYDDTLTAPVTAGEKLGTATYTDDEGNTAQVDLLAAATVEPYSFSLVLQQVWLRFLSVFLGTQASDNAD